MDSELIETIVDGVATLRLNRPHAANALLPQIVEGLLEAIPRLDLHPEVGAIVLTGTGSVFCSGGDIGVMAEADPARGHERRADDLRRKHKLILDLHACSKVTIASLNGAAVGAGMSFALACDFRIAGRSARLIPGFVKMGFSGDFGGSYFLSRFLGPARAQELYLTGAQLGAEEAAGLGLFSRVVDDGDLAAEVESFARSIAAGPRLAQRYIKRNFRVAATGSLSETLESECEGQTRLAFTEDHAEAVRAFREKRQPQFKGK